MSAALMVMNPQTILLLLMQLTGSVSEPEVCHLASKEMMLPISEPRIISVVDGRGRSLMPSRPGPKLEFSQLRVRIPMMPGAAGNYWAPENMAQAAIGLKIMLPANFYARLLRGYGGMEKKWIAADDPAISERWDDLVSFLDRVWGTKWSDGGGEEDPYEQVRKLINYSISTTIYIPDNCGAQK